MQQDFNVEIQSCKLRFIQVCLVTEWLGDSHVSARASFVVRIDSNPFFTNEFIHQPVDVSLCQGLGSHETPPILGTEFKRVNEERVLI